MSRPLESVVSETQEPSLSRGTVKIRSTRKPFGTANVFFCVASGADPGDSASTVGIGSTACCHEGHEGVEGAGSSALTGRQAIVASTSSVALPTAGV